MGAFTKTFSKTFGSVQLGANVNYTDTEIASQVAEWQNTTDLVHVGGAVSVTGTIGISPSSYSYVTVIDTNKMRRIRQDGYVRRVKIKIDYTSTGGQVKFKIFRKIGTDFVLISTSELISFNAAAGVSYIKDIVLSTPIECAIGDYFGCSMPQVQINQPVMDWGAEVGGQVLLKYEDVTGTIAEASLSVFNNYYVAVQALSVRPFASITGDSISVGWVQHKAFYNGESGDITGDPGYQLNQLIPTLLFQNHGQGSSTWSWVKSTGMVSALLVKPKYLVIHCGINDAASSRTIEAILADMDEVLAACIANDTILIIDEITPATNQSDATNLLARQINAEYATWCATNNVKLNKIHDIFGIIRESTDELDNLLPTYSADGIHYSILGTQKMVEYWKNKIYSKK